MWSVSQVLEEHVVVMEKVVVSEVIAHVCHLTNFAPEKKGDFLGLVIYLVIGPLTMKQMGR